MFSQACATETCATEKRSSVISVKIPFIYIVGVFPSPLAGALLHKSRINQITLPHNINF